jgi:very-short-patch-repair endonuclease
VGSPLELKFLRLFEKHGLEVEKQVSVGPDSTSAPISAADFRVTGTKVLIYVDGAAFHTGMRLRRDRAIREALRKGDIGWTVVELRASDLAQGETVIGRIRGAIG